MRGKNFILCGLAGWCIEVAFTSFNALRRKDKKLIGQTSAWMFPIYGMAAGIGNVMRCVTTGDLMDGCTEKLDVFSHHYYNGISERMAPMMPAAYTPAEGAMSEEYLGMAGFCARALSIAIRSNSRWESLA